MTAPIPFSTLVQDDILLVENLIRSQVQSYHPDIKAALELLLSAGGKRIRPALTILAGRMLSAPHEAILTIAAAIELLHTATLVHDDLIDSSLLRRGMPTLNSKWSPGATVLTGDFLFARAAKLAADTNSVPVIKLFAKTLTTIVNGEITQLLSSRCIVDRENYYQRIYAKTASLFETSTQSAALVANESPETIENVRRFGYEIGFAFQILDDILDFTGDAETIGKPVGSDLRQGLITLPAIAYIENHPEDPLIAKLLVGDCPTEEEITHLIDAIRGSSAIKLAFNEASQFAQRGLKVLRKLPASAERAALEEIAIYITQRKI